jgi:hypothetical protein
MLQQSPCSMSHGLDPEMVESRTADQMTLDIEDVLDSGVCDEKLLGRTLLFEPLLLSFPASDR